jgi:hypothetical protein
MVLQDTIAHLADCLAMTWCLRAQVCTPGRFFTIITNTTRSNEITNRKPGFSEAAPVIQGTASDSFSSLHLYRP